MTRPSVLEQIGEGLVAGIPVVIRRRRRQRLASGLAVGIAFLATGTWLALQSSDDGQTVFTDDATPTTLSVEPTSTPQALAPATPAPPPFDGVAALDPVIGRDDVYFVGRVGDDGVVVAAALSLTTGQWRELPEPPVDFGQSPAMAWTGEELIVCCGGGPNTSGTTAYDPAADAWRPMPDSPLGSYADAVWTGELIYVVDNEGFASFDPATESWSTLAAPPDLRGWPGELEWTGERLFVWPRPGQRVALVGSEYDATADRWTQLPIPDLPLPGMASAVWVGDNLLVLGGLPGASADGSERLIGLRWDGEDWLGVPDPLPEPVSSEGNLGSQRVLVVGDRVLVHAGALGSGLDPDDSVLLSFEPATNTWTELGRDPDTALVPLATDGERLVFRRSDGAIIVRSADADVETSPSDLVGEVSSPLGPASFTGGGAEVFDLRLSTGERFRLSVPVGLLPADVRVFERTEPERVVLQGSGVRFTLLFGTCSDPGPTNRLGSVVNVTDDLIRVCRADEGLGMEFTELSDRDELDVGLFDIRPLAFGSRYRGGGLAAGDPSQCEGCSTNGPLQLPEVGLVVNRTGVSVTAVNDETLQEVWSYAAGDNAALYYGLDEIHVAEVGALVQLDPATGAVNWRFDLDDGEHAISVTPDRRGVVVWSSFGTEGDDRAPSVRLLDPSTGELQWQARGPDSTGWRETRPVYLEGAWIHMTSSEPAPDGGTALVAVRPWDGELLWITELPGASPPPSREVLQAVDVATGQVLLVRTAADELTRVDQDTGEILWRAAVDPDGSVGTNFAADGTLAIQVSTPETSLLLHPDTGASLAPVVREPPSTDPVANPVTEITGVLPDGTRYIIRADAELPDQIEGISAGIFVDVIDGQPPIVGPVLGITSFSKAVGEVPPTSTFRSSDWFMTVATYPDVREQLGESGIEAVQSAIEPLDTGDNSGLPAFTLSPPLRWADDHDLPLSMQVIYPTFSVLRGCGEFAVACAPDGAVQLVPNTELFSGGSPWPDIAVEITSPPADG